MARSQNVSKPGKDLVTVKELGDSGTEKNKVKVVDMEGQSVPDLEEAFNKSSPPPPPRETRDFRDNRTGLLIYVVVNDSFVDVGDGKLEKISDMNIIKSTFKRLIYSDVKGLKRVFSKYDSNSKIPSRDVAKLVNGLLMNIDDSFGLMLSLVADAEDVNTLRNLVPNKTLVHMAEQPLLFFNFITEKSNSSVGDVMLSIMGFPDKKAMIQSLSARLIDKIVPEDLGDLKPSGDDSESRSSSSKELSELESRGLSLHSLVKF